MSDEEITDFNRKSHEETEREFNEFKSDLSKGICWVCKHDLLLFDVEKPCQHWLLLPEGFRKKHFKLLFDTCTFDKLESFLRWYVNAHSPFDHINNLHDEHDANDVMGVTIQHADLEWSFNFGKGCLAGRDGTVGPHYHMQVKKGERIVHSYSNRHIRLSEYELWLIDIRLGNNPKIRQMEVYGAGMQDIFDNMNSDDLLAGMHATDDMSKATFRLSNIVTADEGHIISGDDIADLVEESKRTGVPMARLLSRLSNATHRVFIEPGPAVPVAAKRNKHRGARRPGGVSKGSLDWDFHSR